MFTNSTAPSDLDIIKRRLPACIRRARRRKGVEKRWMRHDYNHLTTDEANQLQYEYSKAYSYVRNSHSTSTAGRVGIREKAKHFGENR